MTNTKGKTIPFLTVAAVATTLLVAVPNWFTASAEVLINDKWSFTAIAINECDGGEILVDRDVHYVFRTEGATRDSVHFNTRGTGVNLVTGDEYVFGNTYNDQCIFPEGGFCEDVDGGFNLTWVQRFKLIGKGSAPNLILQIRERLTAPPLEFETLHLNVQCPETD